MTQRIHIVPVEPMALRLAGRRPEDRATRAAAERALIDEGYCREDVFDGLDAALARATAIAASDAPWLRAIGYLRDAVSAFVVLGGGTYLWGWLA